MGVSDAIISGASSACQRNARRIRWRADDGPTLIDGLKALRFSGDQDQYGYETYIFVIFQVCV